MSRYGGSAEDKWLQYQVDKYLGVDDPEDDEPEDDEPEDEELEEAAAEVELERSVGK